MAWRQEFKYEWCTHVMKGAEGGEIGIAKHWKWLGKTYFNPSDVLFTVEHSPYVGHHMLCIYTRTKYHMKRALTFIKKERGDIDNVDDEMRNHVRCIGYYG